MSLRPERGSHDVLPCVKRVGACGTDLHILTGQQPGPGHPRVMGHELPGIGEAAPADSDLRPGDMVDVMPGLSCGRCIARRDGAITEYLSAPQAFMHKADGVSQGPARSIVGC